METVTTTGKNLAFGKALYDYKPSGNLQRHGLSDIGLKKNDFCILLEPSISGWTKGKTLREQKVGFFPSNYVSELNIDNSQKGVLLFDYLATGVTVNGESDLNGTKGSPVLVLEILSSGWTRVVFRGQIGLVPQTHVSSLGPSVFGTGNSSPNSSNGAIPVIPDSPQLSRSPNVSSPTGVDQTITTTTPSPVDKPPVPKRPPTKSVYGTGDLIRQSPIPAPKPSTTTTTTTTAPVLGTPLPVKGTFPSGVVAVPVKSPQTVPKMPLKFPLPQLVATSHNRRVPPPLPTSPAPPTPSSTTSTPTPTPSSVPSPTLTVPAKQPAPVVPQRVAPDIGATKLVGPGTTDSPHLSRAHGKTVGKTGIPGTAAPVKLVPFSYVQPASTTTTTTTTTIDSTPTTTNTTTATGDAELGTGSGYGNTKLKLSEEMLESTATDVTLTFDLTKSGSEEGVGGLHGGVQGGVNGGVDLAVVRCSKCGVIGHWLEACQEGEEEKEENGITFVNHRGKNLIKGASLLHLIQTLYADSTGTNDFVTEFMEHFLMTYRTFASASHVMEVLIESYEGMGEDKAKKLRLINVLRRWLEAYSEDFELDHALSARYQGFLDHLKLSSSSVLITILERAAQKGQSKTILKPVFSQEAPKPLLVGPKVTITSIFDIEPLELARHITLLEHDLFKKVSALDMLSIVKSSRRVSGTNHVTSQSSGFTRLIERFNQFSHWIAYIILREDSPRKRANVILRLLKIGKEILTLNNLNAVFEFVAGFQTSSVFRLKKTWELVRKEKDYGIYEELIGVTLPQNSFSVYRNRLHSAVPPRIPYLGIYQSDLTFIEEGNQDKLPNGYINFFKRRLMAEVIKEIHTYQQEAYNLVEQEKIILWLKHQENVPVDENELYELSLIVEPRDSAAASKQESSRTIGKSNSLGGSSSSDKSKKNSVRLDPEALAGLSEREKARLLKLQQFFGDDFDMSSFQRANTDPPLPSSLLSSDKPESILDDIDLQTQKYQDSIYEAVQQTDNAIGTVIQENDPTVTAKFESYSLSDWI